MTEREDEQRRQLGRRELMAMGAALVAEVSLLSACRPAKVESVSSVTGAGGLPGTGWASGGTRAMRAKASYPDPFAVGPASARSVAGKMTCQLTEGPCYSSQSEAREELSDGLAGLPMRLCLRVLDERGAPVPGALVDVWHVSPAGKYSGNDAEHEDVGFCTDDDPAYSSKLYFRGKQTTDAAGLVGFDTCFPGWYHGRTVHVHLTLSVGGQRTVTTQLCFDDAMVDAILGAHPDYAGGGRGPRDTHNTDDGVFDPKDYGDYLVTTARMSDGAMLASKTIVVRSSPSEALCGDSGPGGPRGPGGPGGPGGRRPPPGFDPSRPPPRHGHPPFRPPPP